MARMSTASSAARLPVLGAAVLVGALTAIQARSPGEQPSPRASSRVWDAEHVSPPLPPLVDHAEVVRRLDGRRVASRRTSSRWRRSANRSKAVRSTTCAAGTGPFGVLLWSQMHGDESTATSALFDLFDYLRRHRRGPGRRAHPVAADAARRADAEP